MSREEAIEHWQKGARESLRAAEVLLQEGSTYSLVLFHCHLAVEKALKAALIQENNALPPHTHDLVALASFLPQGWTEEQRTLLETLTRFAIDARYADPPWAAEYATRECAEVWLQNAKNLLSILHV